MQKTTVTILAKSAYHTTRWSGGTTTQFFIYPKTVTLAERNFLFRISSAKIELESSEFSLFDGYSRVFTSLDKAIEITSNGNAPLGLQPLDIFHFDGAWKTSSVGQCVDFNLIYQKEIEAEFSIEKFESKRSFKIERPKELDFLVVFCLDGQVELDSKIARSGETMVIQNGITDVEINVCEKTTLLISALSFKKD